MDQKTSGWILSASIARSHTNDVLSIEATEIMGYGLRTKKNIRLFFLQKFVYKKHIQ